MVTTIISWRDKISYTYLYKKTPTRPAQDFKSNFECFNSRIKIILGLIYHPSILPLIKQHALVHIKDNFLNIV